ncbi:disease resistance-like protein DSC1 [Gossypium arboreum]|uniref:disease resistance-like protein DSC1 n=1 Tax=Gossypium arboreum TaxID=29729 RepID=UPI0022F198C2|nr:disease resistance-like protein DSC1 [Gossypium arboreum]
MGGAGRGGGGDTWRAASRASAAGGDWSRLCSRSDRVASRHTIYPLLQSHNLNSFMASSSSSRQMKHQVFLSFRGEDTRLNFTSHLLKALKDTGINVFFDEDTLEKGDQLSLALSQAIATSNLSIIVLSVNYASSKSCLAELSDIMDRKDTEGHIVLPIFYHVDPSDVRNLGGRFKTSFDDHESEKLDQVQQWQTAFVEVGKLKGWHIEGGKFDRPETEYIKDIVEYVMKKLMNSKSGSAAEELVGIDDKKRTILRLIDQEDSRVIGLWGMGGIGKTTLADALLNPSVDYRDLSNKFVEYAQGSPLALKVLGSKLYTKTKKDWESEVEKLKEYGQPKILQILKRSFGELDEIEKNIFLDIACIFKRVSKKEAEEVLSCCYKGAACGISNLIDKCLLDIDCKYGEYISVHDMLEEMGKDIVRQESKSIGMRSRLWSPEDVDKVLRYSKGSESIEGITLDMSQIKDKLRLHPSVFENMLSLKYLEFYSCNFDKKLLADEHDIVSLPNELRYLRWSYYPFKYLPSSFNLKNLVVLNLSNGNIEQLLDDNDHQDLVNLRKINVSQCKNLRKIANLLGAINLKTLDCSGCESLVELPCLNRLTSLEFLELEECYSLKEFPELPNNFSDLSLQETGIEEVPDSIDRLTSLEMLVLSNSMVKNVSSHISKLESLGLLDLSYCPIAEFPEIPRNLRVLELRGTQIEEVPFCFDCQSSLTLLDLSYTSIQKLQCNMSISSSGDIKTADVPSSITRFGNLVRLKMNYCNSLKLLSEVPPDLSYLEAHGCSSLEKVTFTDQNLFELPDDIFMIFSNCFNLNQDSIDNILESAMFKAGAQVETRTSLWEIGWESQTFFCFPGNEISANKFEFQSLNSSIDLKIAPNWRVGGGFLAFAICLVADLTDCCHYKNLECICEYQLKATDDGNEKFKTKWYDMRMEI